jgi:hypothetical protein
LAREQYLFLKSDVPISLILHLPISSLIM